ncbi:E3 ubiquitin-protein ligase Praja-2 [Pygocentrus nattereri]|uniref:RING-type E3 ubiquitin transferase n=1 Tax=Pygocentrus nattereri TaxID=42514 RepID=A0A3B4BSG7_PYGNA|nr:E3 ubiquitin-protein ligase Praja-2 [Pygocentrus nattereri]
MGQEAGKTSWPRPAGGYQTITGRRYGRRHAYVSFRPTPYKHRTMSSVDYQEVETNTDHEEHTVALLEGNISSVFPAIFPVQSSNSVDLESKTNQEDYVKYLSSSNIMTECEKWSNDSDCSPSAEKSAGALAVSDEVDRKPPNVGILSFVNIDSYEPDSSGGEEEDLNSSCAIQKKLDMICHIGKDVDDFSHSHTNMHTEFCKLSDCSAKDMPPKSDQEHTHPQRTGKTYGKYSLLGKLQSDSFNESACNGGPCSCIDPECNSMQEAVQSEMVVRPKIRKQTSESHLDKTKYTHSEEVSWISVAKSFKSTCGSAPPFILSHATKTDSLFNFPLDECTLDKTKWAEQNSKVKANDDDCDFWEDLDDFGEKCASPEKANESSEYSEGEWSASWTSDSGLEKERCSSEESWETLPGLEELPSSSCSLEDIPPLSLIEGEQIPLEEGEIPWLRCNEDSDSSSDENPDNMSQFVHPGLFIMDSSNNLEDDSSMSEDLDTEWRLLDDFEEGFGMAQAISYVDHPQLLTYMALEERLAQAMEAALAHLESLAIDVEQAHPPASEQIIDSLPHIKVLEDHRGQEQSCAVCCCEYVNEEIATQLPCRHMFHKLCVTLWLRKSGTCPVCRHILTPPLSGPTTFLSNPENPSSVPSAAGQRE